MSNKPPSLSIVKTKNKDMSYLFPYICQRAALLAKLVHINPDCECWQFNTSLFCRYSNTLWQQKHIVNRNVVNQKPTSSNRECTNENSSPLSNLCKWHWVLVWHDLFKCVSPVKIVQIFPIGKTQNILFEPVEVNCHSPSLLMSAPLYQGFNTTLFQLKFQNSSGEGQQCAYFLLYNFLLALYMLYFQFWLRIVWPFQDKRII